MVNSFDSALDEAMRRRLRNVSFDTDVNGGFFCSSVLTTGLVAMPECVIYTPEDRLNRG